MRTTVLFDLLWRNMSDVNQREVRRLAGALYKNEAALEPLTLFDNSTDKEYRVVMHDRVILTYRPDSDSFLLLACCRRDRK